MYKLEDLDALHIYMAGYISGKCRGIWQCSRGCMDCPLFGIECGSCSLPDTIEQLEKNFKLMRG